MDISYRLPEDYTGELRKRLKAYKISQGALAREMGVPDSQMSRWLNKPGQPRWATIRRFEAAIAKIRKEQARSKST